MENAFTVKLEKAAHGGYCLGRHSRQVVFVPYALPGELVRVEPIERKKNFTRAQPAVILEASADRAEAPCPHFGPGGCGGCHWQHARYDAQLLYKQEVVADQLRRLGHFQSPPVLPTIANPRPFGYRHSVTFMVAEDGSLAYYGDDINPARLLPIDVCPILHPALLELLGHIQLDVTDVVRVRLQVGSDPADRMLILETGNDMAPAIKVKLPVSVNLLLSDNEPVNLIGSSHIIYTILGRQFRVTAGSFFQVSPDMAAVLVEQVLQSLALEGHESVLDLYSGVGLFTGFIAQQAGIVVSVESYPPAVSDADENLADLDNIDLIEGSVLDVLADLDEQVDAVVVDPPPSGLGPAVIAQIDRLAPTQIVYVSSDPATLARDAASLVSTGFVLETVQPVDMLPQTYHIECVAHFTRSGIP